MGRHAHRRPCRRRRRAPTARSPACAAARARARPATTPARAARRARRTGPPRARRRSRRRGPAASRSLGPSPWPRTPERWPSASCGAVPSPYTVSVGNTMSDPARAARGRLGRPDRRSWPRRDDHPVAAREVGCTETCTAPASSAASGDGLGLPFADLDHERAAGPKPARPAASTAARTTTTPPTSASTGSARTSARQRVRTLGLDVGRVAHDQVERAASRRHRGPAAGRSRSTSTSRPRRPALSPSERDGASSERSTAHTRASGRSCLIARAMAPVPVPTSTTAGDATPRERLERGVDHHLGLGPRHEHPGPHDQREMTEPGLAR